MTTTLNLSRCRAPGRECVVFDAEFTPPGLGDPANDALQGMLAGGDAAVVAWFRVSIGFEDRDDGFFFMNVESEVGCPCRV
jgi:hypothetical protein